MKRIVMILLGLAETISAGRLLLLVVDGLTRSLLDRVSTPGLDSLLDGGVEFSVRPEFPADTLPTLQAMLTGQHVEMTGILGAEVYDKGNRLTSVDSTFWQYNPNITSIGELNTWTKTGSTGCIRFPGCDFYPNQELIKHWQKSKEMEHPPSQEKHKESAGRRTRLKRSDSQTDPNITKQRSDSGQSNVTKSEKIKLDGFFFNKSSDQGWQEWTDQAESVVGWLTADNPTNLVLYYLEQPAEQIRAFGPDSPQADLAVYKVDQFIIYLLDLLDRHKLTDSVNVVVTGLHGYVEVSAETVFDISNLVDAKDYRVYGKTPVLNLQPVQVDKELDIFAALQRGDQDKFNLYNKHGIPDTYKYKNNDRVTDIVLVAKEGFAFANTFYSEVKELNHRAERKNVLSNKYGFSGYDNSLESMKSILIARGPAIFKATLQQRSEVEVQAVDVFPLMAHLLGLEPPKTNGSLESFRGHLSHPPSQTVQVFKKAIDYIKTKDALPTAGILILGTVLLIALGCICCCRCKKKDISKNHSYRYSTVKSNRRHESRVDGSEETTDDNIGLLTSAIMQEDVEFDQTV